MTQVVGSSFRIVVTLSWNLSYEELVVTLGVGGSLMPTPSSDSFLQDASAGRRGLVACAKLMVEYDRCMSKVPPRRLVRVRTATDAFETAAQTDPSPEILLFIFEPCLITRCRNAPGSAP